MEHNWNLPLNSIESGFEFGFTFRSLCFALKYHCYNWISRIRSEWFNRRLKIVYSKIFFFLLFSAQYECHELNSLSTRNLLSLIHTYILFDVMMVLNGLEVVTIVMCSCVCVQITFLIKSLKNKSGTKWT